MDRNSLSGAWGVAVIASMLIAPVIALGQGEAECGAKSGLDKTRCLAEQGSAAAQNNLGLMYDTGQGVPRDDATAVEWYRKAAERGYAVAQSNLGFMYDTGQGVPQDDATAVEWFRKAAEQGDAEAQHNLGVMYAEGLGVPQDYVKAHMWANLAASRLPPGDKRKNAVNNLNVVEARMTPEQIAEAQRLAREWKPATE